MNTSLRQLPRITNETNLLNRLFKDAQKVLRKDPLDQINRGQSILVRGINYVIRRGN